MPPNGRRRKKKVGLGKLYSFATCGKKGFGEEHSRIGTPGFSRIVCVNDPNCDEAQSLNYVLNYISTTKYTLVTFLPKSLFEQFRRVANFYFLLSGCLAFTPLAPYTAVSAILPLLVVIGATMAKEGIEDWRRKQQDHEVNSRKVTLHVGNGDFQTTTWDQLRVGDIVKVQKDEFFPADLVLLSSSYEDGICYVETMNLDGETNLKLKQGLEVTFDSLHDDAAFAGFLALVKCEDPNPNLYSFVGNIVINEQTYPLSPQQILLRDSKLRNTEYVYGAVIFTGHDSKAMQNSTDPPSKRSKIERRMDKIIYLLLCSLVTISFIGSIFFGIWTKHDDGTLKRWYLRPDDSTVYFDPNRAALAAVCHFLTAMMLYSYFIPISLYISIEIVKLLQALFINQDMQMYHKESDTPAQARTSNLNEELGQVDTILSDKTGTLTCNSMEFIKCSIGGTAYGHGVTEVERAMAKRKGVNLSNEDTEEFENNNHNHFGPDRPKVKGYNFDDPRIVNGNWMKEKNRDVIENFFRLLAICHTCIPEVDEETGQVTYEAESPDEAAFVIAARELGFEFFERTHTSVSIHERDPKTGDYTTRTYKLLNVLEFSSARKRMSVIVKDENDGQIILLCKGADSVMFERLSKTTKEYEEVTREHINQYADAGLRTLVLAYRELEQSEYEKFNKKFMAAKNSVGPDRDEKIEDAADSIERDLILLGATAVEDKLQNGVPECIDKLAQAGIKIWVLTGDKMETAINIGFACSLLRQGMNQIIITLDTPDIVAIEKTGDKNAIAKASKESVTNQIEEGRRQIEGSVSASFALIIDGKSLTYALEDDVKNKFLNLAIRCGSVICCRSSPKQKALVTRLVKEGTRKVTLGIGDGANDVGMLQEADIGVGISGAEGMQAVMASDIAIAQFRFLERLLLVHGHWCYRRISSMICYFFYKNITFGVTLFLYEAHTSFSGQPAYNDWFLSLYNVFFTSLPVLALGVFDQDVSARFCLKFPQLYQEGVKNVLFSWFRIIGSMLHGVISACIIFFLCTNVLKYQAFRSGGQTASLDVVGTTMYSCVVWVVNCQMALSVYYLTLVHHIFIWGGIIFWYLFLLAYGSIPPSLYSRSPYKVLTERAGPAPSFWLVTLFVSVTTLIPFVVYSSVQFRFFPMYHNLIQWWRHLGRTEDLELMRQRSVRMTTVGVSARLEAQLSIRSADSQRSPI
ncbi:Phospholipid-transporting ATPase [Rhynchospora pubera]|uniref:Phospholipid-transporting ATPase n=1 Tax=Rhynchospora pubera TaxID=906938 RepID=A0AAV8DW42_9POAL|nr:Phospholipid-transporting ATPase [Rhynchospora pubera]